MKDNTDDVVMLLRGIADALEQNRASFVNYEMHDDYGPHRARETDIEIRVTGFDPRVLLGDG